MKWLLGALLTLALLTGCDRQEATITLYDQGAVIGRYQTRDWHIWGAAAGVSFTTTDGQYLTWRGTYLIEEKAP